MLTNRRAGASAALVSLLTVGAAPTAGAATSDISSCINNEFVCLEAEDRGTDRKSGGSQPAAGESGGQDSGPEGGSGKPKPPECTPPKKLDPQPPAPSKYWEGHDPADGGAVYVQRCRYYMESGTSNLITETVYGGPGGAPPAPAVDPTVLAQQAVDRMRLRGPEIGITPKPGGMGVIGMPVYMWTATGPETYGPNTASATAGAVTVSAVAKVSKIVWTMGDGKTVVCTTAGTPYKKSYGAEPSPDCGHRYTRPSSTEASGKYHVTATSTWTIDWTGGGTSGQLTEVRDSDVDIAVAEVQVVN